MNAKKALHEIKVFLVMILIISSLRSALADWNDVPTGSMKPTIQEGDRVVVNKLAYDLKVPFTMIELAKWGDPKRGDIVVLFSPEDGVRLVKRVVAVPGDRIEMRNEQLFVNGQAAHWTALGSGRVANSRAEPTAPRSSSSSERLGVVRRSIAGGNMCSETYGSGRTEWSPD